jgi:hypothetical protein
VPSARGVPELHETRCGFYFFEADVFRSACLLFMACEIFFRAAALIFRRGLAAGWGACSCGSCRG